MLMMFVLLMLNPGDLEQKLTDALTQEPAVDLQDLYQRYRPNGVLPEDENRLNNLGYTLFHQDKDAAGLAVFKLNTVLFPKSANPWDSLGEGYLHLGEAAKAVDNYYRAFELSGNRQIWDRMWRALETLDDAELSLRYGQMGVTRFADAVAEDRLLALEIQLDRAKNPLGTFKRLAKRYPGEALWRARRALEAKGTPAPVTDDGWRTASYQAKGLDDGLYKALLAKADTVPRLEGVVVAVGDAIIGEAYWHGFTRHRPHDTRSVGKSVTALVVAAAISKGQMDLDDRLYDAFPSYRNHAGWDARQDQIRMRHLLGMSLGLDAFDSKSDSPGNENVYQGGVANWRDHVLKLPYVYEPGSQLVYASAAYLLAGDMLAAKTGTPMDDYAQTHLFDPMKIRTARWFQSPQGDAYGAGGIRMTPRDLAKMGALILNEGRWQGAQLIDQGVIKTLTTPTIEGEFWGKRYAMGWYVHQETIDGRPIKVISAAGNGGQRIWVMPELDAVVVVTMGNYNRREQGQADVILREYLLPSLMPPK